MNAVEISEFGGPEVLKVVERPTPSTGAGEVLVRVEAAGVNRPDLSQRAGKYAPPPGASDIPGLEIAGTVVSIGADVARWQPGDRVCALIAGGGYAEYCVAPEPQCLPIPRGLQMIEAAALPETFFTVWTNLFQRARLGEGELALIHGGTSGIGTTAIQLGRAFGATMIGTAGSDEKCTTIERLGATAINYRTTDFVQAIRDLTSGRGVDVILDIIGGSYLQRNLDSLAMNGRLLQVGLQGGAKADINLAVVMQRHLTLTGSLLRPRTPAAKGAIARELEVKVWPLLAARQVKPIIDRTYPLASAAEAHRALESGEVVGKVVLTI
jgi:NADPH:quinone reductase